CTPSLTTRPRRPEGGRMPTATPSVQLLRADRVLTPGREIADGWVVVEKGQIAAVGQGEPPVGLGPEPGTRYVVLCPGFVDIHDHGGGGASFGSGPEAARTA